jgi:hypothetical protein
MAESEIERLAAELLATGEMNEETTADLTRMREEARAGTLDADDAAYVAALYGRLLGEGAVVAEPERSSEEIIADLEAQLREAIARAERAEAELPRVKGEDEGAPPV